MGRQHEDRREHRPRPKTEREYLQGIDAQLDRIEKALAFITRKVDRVMALTVQEADAFAALVAKIDELFAGSNAPLIAELRAQIEALSADDEADAAEIARLQEIVTNAETAEADVLAAIQGVSDHLTSLGTESTTTTEPPA